MFDSILPKDRPTRKVKTGRSFAALRKAGLCSIAIVMQRPKLLNGKRIEGQNYQKRQRAGFRKTFTQLQWNEMHRAMIRERRAESGDGAFGGEKKMRKLA